MTNTSTQNRMVACFHDRLFVLRRNAIENGKSNEMANGMTPYIRSTVGMSSSLLKRTVM